ncbi:GNAT family N-acetyltransferase [Candidatus Micrarchaeota archaeon]|nr:GNAT family N-acetyltransferase [Candidatus Micrarchaeota archaeon]
MAVRLKKFQRVFYEVDGFSLEVREAKPADAKRLWEIQRQKKVNNFLLFSSYSFEKYKKRFLSRLRDFDGKTVVAALDGIVIGRAFLKLGRGRASHVANFGIFIDEGFQGKGIGRILMRELFNYAKSIGVEKLEDEAFSDNKRALRFYKKLGFRIEGVRKRKFVRDGRHFDSVLIGKFL